jgi:hypothetical protein
MNREDGRDVDFQRLTWKGDKNRESALLAQRLS